ncbi:4Fe-4S binding protein [Desulfitobacterium sp. PCE1]|uniref:4Fe-4S binding protein n=1 Tax=Desulfitobacterium sp. PCE1 TaxID=146907 RepID=UPI00037CE691|nr:4Fe-4S binding protein [Desulfitobacterium sp. PCE1]
MFNTQFNKAKGKTGVIVFACLLLLMTFIYQQGTNKQDLLGLLQQGEPSASQFKEVEGAYKSYALYNQEGTFLSYGVISSASGYGGPITMLTIVSEEGKIANAVLLDDSETPLYLKKVLVAGYPENFLGKTVSEPLEAHEDIDIVSGATRTAKGMMLAVEKGMYQVGENHLGLKVPPLKTFHFQWQDGLVVLMLALAILASSRNMKKLRPWILVAAVFVLGFMENVSLTIGNYMSIIALKMPTFSERPIWYVMVIGVFLITLFWGRNFYCSWLCPFGAVQEGIYRALNLANYHPHPRLVTIARKSRWFFLWLAALLALLLNNPGIASYEPFSVFFDADGNTSQWIIMGIILLFSIFILRFWCRCFCPVGAFLDFTALCKRKASAILGRKSIPSKSDKREEGCPGQCAGCLKEEAQQTSLLISSDKILAAGIGVLWILIIGALLQNIGLF